MSTTVLTQVIARLLFAPVLLTALAVLVKGYASTGDGFSAGVIAAVGVLLQYVAFGYREAERLLPVRAGLPLAFAGLLLGLLVAFVPVMRGEAVLTHWPPAGSKPVYLGTVELITAVAFDVGIFLLVLGFSVQTIAAIAHTIERRRP